MRLLTSSEGDAPRDDKTLRLLKLKHPPSSSDLALPGPPQEDDALHAVTGGEYTLSVVGGLRRVAAEEAEA